MKKKQFIRILRIVMPIVSVVCLAIFAPWTIVRAWIAPIPDTIQEQVERAVDNFKFDGMIVYVEEAGQTPAFYTAGWHDRDAKIPARPNALFKIASIGKLYDAVAITKLIHEKRLSLDKTLADYFPELVGRIEYAESITLRMLVQHRSGIPNITNTPNFWIDPPQSSQEALALVLDLPAEFEPGKKYKYSNTNYLLLSELIEKITGEGKFQYIKEEILNPLGLKNTYGSIKEVNMDELMSGYYVGVEKDIKTTDYGSMVATAQDVGIFLRALNDGSLFEEGEQEIYSALYEFEHTGLIPGYQSVARYDKELDTVVIQFVNTTDFSDYLFTVSEIISNRIFKILKKQRR